MPEGQPLSGYVRARQALPRSVPLVKYLHEVAVKSINCTRRWAWAEVTPKASTIAVKAVASTALLVFRIAFNSFADCCCSITVGTRLPNKAVSVPVAVPVFGPESARLGFCSKRSTLRAIWQSAAASFRCCPRGNRPALARLTSFHALLPGLADAAPALADTSSQGVLPSSARERALSEPFLATDFKSSFRPARR